MQEEETGQGHTGPLLHAFADAYMIDKHCRALEHDNEDDNESLLTE